MVDRRSCRDSRIRFTECSHVSYEVINLMLLDWLKAHKRLEPFE